MVCRRRHAGQARDRGGALRRDSDRPQDMGKDLLQLDGKHPAVVCLSPIVVGPPDSGVVCRRSEEHTSELQSLMRISYAVFCLKKKKNLQKIIRVHIRKQDTNVNNKSSVKLK